MKICRKCRTAKDLIEFGKDARQRDGHKPLCKACRRNEPRKKYPYDATKQQAYDQKRYTSIDRCILSPARQRARMKGIPFSLTENDIYVPLLCPILGIPLFRSKGAATANSPTLDRIVQSQGYVKGNVQVISYRANTMKNDASPRELLAFAAWVEKVFG